MFYDRARRIIFLVVLAMFWSQAAKAQYLTVTGNYVIAFEDATVYNSLPDHTVGPELLDSHGRILGRIDGLPKNSWIYSVGVAKGRTIISTAISGTTPYAPKSGGIFETRTGGLQARPLNGLGVESLVNWVFATEGRTLIGLQGGGVYSLKDGESQAKPVFGIEKGTSYVEPIQDGDRVIIPGQTRLWGLSVGSLFGYPLSEKGHNFRGAVVRVNGGFVAANLAYAIQVLDVGSSSAQNLPLPLGEPGNELVNSVVGWKGAAYVATSEHLFKVTATPGQISPIEDPGHSYPDYLRLIATPHGILAVAAFDLRALKEGSSSLQPITGLPQGVRYLHSASIGDKTLVEFGEQGPANPVIVEGMILLDKHLSHPVLVKNLPSPFGEFSIVPFRDDLLIGASGKIWRLRRGSDRLELFAAPNWN